MTQRHYWAIRLKSTPDKLRIEPAPTPQEAGRLAYGRNLMGFEYKDLGTKADAIRTQKAIRAVVLSDGWQDFINEGG